MSVFGASLYAAQHCLVTGGSQGLGLALAKQLVGQGASVTIVARRESLLTKAKAELEDLRMHKDQRVFAVSADVTDCKQAREAVEKAGKAMGTPPEAVFCCAGAAKPGFFVDQPLEDFDQGMRLNYLGAVNTIQPAVREMIDKKARGRVVLVSSTLGLTGLIGYSQYSPTKYALRGLAECLRQEFLMYGISVHIYYTSTIRSPGYAAENATKPDITKKIEGSEVSDPSPASRAATLLEGISKDQFAISSDVLTDVFRASSLGSSCRNNVLVDSILMLVGWLVLPVWRLYADRLVGELRK